MEKLTFKLTLLLIALPVSLFVTGFLFYAQFDHELATFCHNLTGVGECCTVGPRMPQMAHQATSLRFNGRLSVSH